MYLCFTRKSGQNLIYTVGTGVGHKAFRIFEKEMYENGWNFVTDFMQTTMNGLCGMKNNKVFVCVSCLDLFGI